MYLRSSEVFKVICSRLSDPPVHSQWRMEPKPFTERVGGVAAQLGVALQHLT